MTKTFANAVATGSMVACSFFAMNHTLSAATTPERSTIEDSAKWDLSLMYGSDTDWSAHYAKLEGMVKELAGRKGTVGTSDKALLEALKLRDQISVQLEKLFAFASMRRDEDMRQTGPRLCFREPKRWQCNVTKRLPGCSPSC